jgi:mono/diheme cytochrome c family protein
MNKPFAVLAVLVALAAGAAVYCSLIMTGPDMIDQPSIRAYDARMPVLPEDAVPAVPGLFFPSERQTEAASSQAVPTLARGKFAYDAYCIFCHGDTGDGEAPVGQSYAPGPGNLRTEKVRVMDDQALQRAMLTGIGHDPVLRRVVPPDDRPSLLLYVRALAQGQQPEEPSRLAQTLP